MVSSNRPLNRQLRELAGKPINESMSQGQCSTFLGVFHVEHLCWLARMLREFAENMGLHRFTVPLAPQTPEGARMTGHNTR
jgi:hypothetical protein